MDDTSELGGRDSGIESMGSSEIIMFIKVSVPDLNLQKSFQFNHEESVWKAKQQILSLIAKSLKDGFNYGFYCPPANGKAGKFLDEERLLKEYSLPGQIGFLEFKLKKRVYKNSQMTAKRSKQLHSKGNLKQLMEHVKKGECDRIIKLLNKGMDPNFIESDSGETPLTMAALLPRSSSLIMTLVSGGCHLDFRNKKEFTPLHVAAQKGNEEAIRTLLDLGSSANYKDLRGMTALYLSVSNDVSARCVEMLLYDHSALGVTDEYGWTELHQCCKAGRVQHLELLMYYGADLNKQNCGGNTALHISAINDQEECVRTLLFRGADRYILNYTNKNAYQCAVVAGNIQLADVIKNLSTSDIVPYQYPPKYNEKRRSIHLLGTGTLQRCRSNPHMNSSNYEFIDDVILPQVENRAGLWDHHHQTIGTSTMGRNSRRVTALPGLSLFNASNSVSSSSSHHFSGCNRSLSISSAELSQAEGEILLHHKSSESFLLRNSDETRLVSLVNGSSGFGFVLRGAKATDNYFTKLNFQPFSFHPALQYFDHVEQGNSADRAGVRVGDFLLEVNGVDVTAASHEYTVSLIRNSPQLLQLLITTPKFSSNESHDHEKYFNATSTDLSSYESKPLSSLKLFANHMDTEVKDTMNGCPADQKVASIRSVHGKRLACNLPKDEPDNVRIVSVPSYNANSLSRKFLWKAKSVQSIPVVDDICYMFDDEIPSTVVGSPSRVSPALMFYSKSNSSKDFDSQSINSGSSTGKPNHPPQPPVRKCGVKLSTFATLSKSGSDLRRENPEFNIVQSNIDKNIPTLIDSKSNKIPTPPPLPPPLLLNYENKTNDLIKVKDEKNKRKNQIKQDLDFLALAENARRVFLKHQMNQKTSELCANMKSVANVSGNKINGINLEDQSDRSECAHVQSEKRFVLDKIDKYDTTKEISKMALVSNRRQIFEVYDNLEKEYPKNINSLKTCEVTSKDIKYDILKIEKRQNSPPVAPKTLHKPSNVSFNQSSSIQVTHASHNNRVHSNNYQLVNHIQQLHRSVTPLPPLLGPPANPSVTSNLEDSSEFLFIPPPPGFEDVTESPRTNPNTFSTGNNFQLHKSRASCSENSQEECPRSVGEWTVDDVATWLTKISMGEHKESFIRNRVDGKKLSNLGRKDLISLGVVQVGQRMNIERAVKKIILYHS